MECRRRRCRRRDLATARLCGLLLLLLSVSEAAAAFAPPPPLPRPSASIRPAVGAPRPSSSRGAASASAGDGLAPGGRPYGSAIPVGGSDGGPEDDRAAEEDGVRGWSVHLISLPPLTDSLPRSLRDLWRWKDSALGDGRDYFVPRPRALGALSSLLVGRTVEDCPGSGGEGRKGGTGLGPGPGPDPGRLRVEECGVLSNCARLDVVLVCRGGGPSCDPSSHPSLAARRAVAEVLASQLRSYRRRGGGTNPALEGVASFLDLPGAVDVAAPPAEPDLAGEVESHLVHAGGAGGAEGVVRHLCRVAAGMAPRPSRPGRPVPFRPFSSRDAHVMLQLKRASEAARGSRVKVLFDYALRAGKAARDVGRVPDIGPLRGYGAGGKYSSEAPAALTARATEAAMELAVEPAIRGCLSKLLAMDASDEIAALRHAVDWALSDEGIDVRGNAEARRAVNTLLHRPCADLREGRTVDGQAVLDGIREELRGERVAPSSPVA